MLALFVLPVIPFPAIDPVMFEIGPIALRWYGLSYVAGILLGWRFALRLSRRPAVALDSRLLDDFVLWAAIGTVLGGRLGSVLFYNLPYYAANPVQALYIWQGGMSFHGGMLGVTAAMVLFAWRHKIPVLVQANQPTDQRPLCQPPQAPRQPLRPQASRLQNCHGTYPEGHL